MTGPDGVRRCQSAYTWVEVHADRMCVRMRVKGREAVISVPGTDVHAARHLLQVAVIQGVRRHACQVIARLAKSLAGEA